MVNPRYTPIYVGEGFKRLVGGTVTEKTGKDISAASFKIALGSSATVPPASGWVVPTVNEAGPGEPLPNAYGVEIPSTAQRDLQLLVDSSTPDGIYHVWARIPDDPEIEAVWLAGPITVVNGADPFRLASAEDTPVVTFAAYDVWSDASTIAGSPGRFREKRVGAAEVVPPANQASTADLDLTGSTHYRYHGFPSASDFASNSTRSVSTPLKPGGASQFANWLFGLEFVTSSPVVNIALNPVGTNVILGFITVNGLRISNRATIFTATGGNPTEAVLTFPAAGERTIRIEGLNQNQGRFGGVTVQAGYTVTKPTSRVQRRIAFLGDSFVNGNGITSDGASETETFVWRLATLMGGDEVIQAGVGGTGFVNGGGDGAAGLYSARVPAILAMVPDVLVLSGGYNDTVTGLAAAISAVLTATSGVPERYLIFTGNDPAVGAVYQSAAAAAGVPYVAPNIAGLPKMVADGVHPTWAGHQTLADEAWSIIEMY